jgi:hypothetical protein
MTRKLGFILLFLTLVACQRQPGEPAIGTGFVSAASVNLRDKLGAQQITVGTLKQGERLQILQRTKHHWLKVRTASKLEGWIEEKNLVTQDMFEQFEKLRQTAAAKPSQGTAHARFALNLHLTPGRKTPYYYSLKEEESCEVVGRATTEKPPRANQPEGVSQSEDWFLVRNATAVGWGLVSNLDMSVPDEVLQYAEGKRVVAWFVLDPGPALDHPTILWATSSAMGLPYDFDSLRVFVWATRHKRYETGYVEHNARGNYPIQILKNPPGFIVTTQNKQGVLTPHKFVLDANRVRRAPVL